MTFQIQTTADAVGAPDPGLFLGLLAAPRTGQSNDIGHVDINLLSLLVRLTFDGYGRATKEKRAQLSLTISEHFERNH